MDAEKLELEILRIAQLAPVEHEPGLQALKNRCKLEAFPQRIGDLRKLLSNETNKSHIIQTENAVSQMDEKYFVLRAGSKVRVATFDEDTDKTGSKKRRLSMLSVPDFKLWEKGKPETEIWLNSPNSRSYRGLFTDPDLPAEHGGRLNMWTDFGIEPAPGDVSPFLYYNNYILGNGDPAQAWYILRWVAWVVQNPAKRIGVLLCLISEEEGTGKGTLGNLLLKIFGLHGVSISSAEQLVGKFNAHLADKCFAFIDETVFGAKESAKMRVTITEPTINIEPKGIDAMMLDNMLSMLMGTNSVWASSISTTDRRYAIFEVNGQKRPREYWNHLHSWLGNGGANAVLAYLQTLDLTGFHPVDSRPVTQIYQENKRRSLTDHRQWWAETVEAQGFETNVPFYQGTTGIVTKDHVYRDYKAWRKSQRGAPIPQQQFFKDLYVMGGGAIEQYRPRYGDERTRCLRLADWDVLEQELAMWLHG